MAKAPKSKEYGKDFVHTGRTCSIGPGTKDSLCN